MHPIDAAGTPPLFSRQRQSAKLIAGGVNTKITVIASAFRPGLLIQGLT